MSVDITPDKRWHHRLGEVIRDAWLIVGISLLILAMLEAVYRAQAAVRNERQKAEAVAPWKSPRHPQAHESWWSSVPAIAIYGSNIRYDPYRGFWATPLTSPVINVDSAGLRVTHQPLASDSGAAKVLFLGGSVMWGWIVPDSLTIPSLAAESLAARGARVFVRNFGQPTMAITQETATLMLELRAGRVPDLVVFLDGINEVASAWETGEVGHIQTEELFARRFADGRQTGVFGQLLRAGGQLHLVQRLLMFRHPQRTVAGPNDGLCPEIARQYVAMTREVQALGREFGFKPVFLWQPSLATTGKARGPFEKEVGFDTGWPEMVSHCSAQVVSMMASRDAAFYDLKSIFDRDSVDIFWDYFGHVTERGNAELAGRIAGIIAPLLGTGAAGH